MVLGLLGFATGTEQDRARDREGGRADMSLAPS